MLRSIWPRIRRLSKTTRVNRHSVVNYTRLVKTKLAEHPGNPALALAQAIGSPDLDTFRAQGDMQVGVLRHHGLVDGMALYDLGCGCGRTAQALLRSGWTGHYTGADIVPQLIVELTRTCPPFTGLTVRDLRIAAADGSLDMVFCASVFTHLHAEESYIYLEDIFRALKPGGRLVFSFCELEDPAHHGVFDRNVHNQRRGNDIVHLNAFLHRDWIRLFAARLGFGEPRFTAGDDTTHHGAFWQSLAILEKPPA
ncbi:MAG: class I SAM-dependent methyltransferase [Sphingomonadales bacterium]|nr:class I SAM-dependent methyltransferase [Sphingomonadales bacterium]